MAGFLAAAGLIGGAASAAGHGLADSHKRAGDVGGADVIFQTATADNVFCLEHHCGFHFRCVADIARGGIERAHELEHADTEAGGINTDVSGIKTASVTASDFVTATVPVVTVKASTRVTLDTPEVVCTNRLITGTLEVQKGGTMRGNIEHTGGELSSNGKVLHTHKHPGDSGGTTGGPL